MNGLLIRLLLRQKCLMLLGALLTRPVTAPLAAASSALPSALLGGSGAT